MKGIKGELASLPITDLVQLLDSGRKTGVLFVSHLDAGRCFCFEEGKLLFSSTLRDGEKFGDIVARYLKLDKARLVGIVDECRQRKTSVITHMIEAGMLTQEVMKSTLMTLAEESMIEVLAWDDGTFEFVEDLPSIVARSPIQISANHLMFEAVRKFDEMKRHR